MIELSQSDLTRIANDLLEDRDEHDQLLPLLGEYLSFSRQSPDQTQDRYRDLVHHLAIGCDVCREAEIALSALLDEESSNADQVESLLAYENDFSALWKEPGTEQRA